MEAKFDAVRRANTWLNEHLTELRNQVEATDQAVQVFEVQHNLVSDGKNGATVNQQQLSELNTQLILAAADRAQKEANLKQVQDQLRSGGVDSSPQISIVQPGSVAAYPGECGPAAAGAVGDEVQAGTSGDD